MKRCGKCKEELPYDSFNKSAARKDGYQNSCKKCRADYGKQWYADNQQVQYRRVKNNQLVIDKYVYGVLCSSKCVDCPESRPAALQFDHIDPTTKLFGLSNAGTNVGSLKKVKEEIAKCVIRCANCHSVRTAEQFGWYNRFTTAE